MGKWKKYLCFSVNLLVFFALPACWDYREVNQLAIVAGMGIDNGVNEKFRITVEIIQVGGGQEVKMTPEVLSMEGETIFDAVRNLMAISGKRTYWGHVQVAVISEAIAREGMTQVLKWFRQDAETRGNVLLLISKEDKAGDILKADTTVGDMVSFILRDSVRNSEVLSKMPVIEVSQFNNMLETEGISPIAPVVFLKKEDERKIPFVDGAAVFSMDQLIGFLDGDETKEILFLQDELKGGVLVLAMNDARITLEITDNKTKTKSNRTDDAFRMEVVVKTTAAIDEVEGFVDFDKPETIDEIELAAEKMLKDQLARIIRKVQINYNTDLFGFGEKISKQHIDQWRDVSQEWDAHFSDLPVDVQVEMKITNTAMVSKPTERGN